MNLDKQLLSSDRISEQRFTKVEFVNAASKRYLVTLYIRLSVCVSLSLSLSVCLSVRARARARARVCVCVYGTRVYSRSRARTLNFPT